jgi:hypothetical protein
MRRTFTMALALPALPALSALPLLPAAAAAPGPSLTLSPAAGGRLSSNGNNAGRR